MILRRHRAIQRGLSAIAAIAALPLLAQQVDNSDPVPIPDFLKRLLASVPVQDSWAG